MTIEKGEAVKVLNNAFAHIRPTLISAAIPCFYFALVKRADLKTDLDNNHSSMQIFFAKQINAFIFTVIAVICYSAVWLIFGMTKGFNISAENNKFFFGSIFYALIVSLSYTSLMNLIAILTHSFWLTLALSPVPFLLDMITQTINPKLSFIDSFA